MINLTSLAKFYPENEKPFKRHIIREYLQYKILSIIFKSPYAQKLSFLGGTNLRIIHGNNRFSEDLDFDNFNLTKTEFSDLANSVKSDLENEGYLVEIKNVYKGAFRSYIKLPKILFDNQMAEMIDEKIVIQIDTAAHNFSYKPDLEIINKFEVLGQIFCTPLDIILSQKIYAAFNRKRLMGRDFFDIVFLLPLVKPNYSYLKKKIGVDNPEKLKQYLTIKCEGLDFDELSEDVKNFQIHQDGIQRVKMFKEIISSHRF